MEIVNSAGVRIFLASEMVEEGLVWETVTEPGYWLGALLTGRLEVRRSPFGESRLAGGETMRFSLREPIETRHRALSAEPISAVFVNFSVEAAHEILGEEASAGFDDRRRPLRPSRNSPVMAEAMRFDAPEDLLALRRATGLTSRRSSKGAI